jgi:hypothetical protein
MSHDAILQADRVFSDCTGAAVRVAIVDSGINGAHSHVQRVAGGVHIAGHPDGGLGFDSDFRDLLGHGTAVAGILRAYCPDVELYAVRVFERTLTAYAHVIAAAIDWAAEQRMQVINLSLGTGNRDHYELLRAACERAERAGATIIAAADSGAGQMFPASLANVIAVCGDERCRWGEYLPSTGGVARFRAHPAPRPLPGRPQQRNLHGHSFAAAHISGLAARIRQARPQATAAELIAMLAPGIGQQDCHCAERARQSGPAPAPRSSVDVVELPSTNRNRS